MITKLLPSSKIKCTFLIKKKAFDRTQTLDENEFMSPSFDIDEENEATYLIPAKRSNLKTIFKRISFLLLFILISIILLLSRFFFQ